MRDPEKYTWFDNQQNYIQPRPAPRLPRNHLLIPREIPLGRRIARALAIGAIVLYVAKLCGVFH